MKHVFTVRRAFPVAVASAVVPVILLGCGGGNSTINPLPTAAPTTSPTTSSTTQPTTSPTTSSTTRPTTAPTTRPTTRPTITPTTSACTNEPANLMFSAFSASYNGSRVNTTCGTGFASALPGNPNSIATAISLFEGVTATVKQRQLNVSIDSTTPIGQGHTYFIGARESPVRISYVEFRGASNTALVWDYTKSTGRIFVQNLSSSSITLVLTDVPLNSRSGGAAGSFTLNGTFVVPRQ